MTVSVTVNGKLFEDESESVSLLALLRDRWGLLGTKNACEEGECGSCTVRLDDVLVNACLVLATQADGREVTTVEGMATDAGLHPVQQAFVDAGAVQCGFCTSGMVLAADDLLRRVPCPTAAEVRAEMAGNLCRCTGYRHIVDAVCLAAERTTAEQV
ncbi:(2Fe-2S)-binding protein [Kibdelosporangium phytohabitans]|uniref:(2Fe-2S)-binding protein n=1 Tax=Kibdelosporangium phytohabitans TaxID=860235 RepID=A0A0N9I1H1_9PSEU|nr:(2Fe-2S)-binding protein [Kibdelosporangium phytohabitans]ALG09672.1 (2Fe-2S)-binding protein [Kibdelosporangium phytohabitans]MBE1468981.1 carbon-monoxide dehydrogenase small subunit [Kibdelosporangium phytohabitans]